MLGARRARYMVLVQALASFGRYSIADSRRQCSYKCVLKERNADTQTKIMQSAEVIIEEANKMNADLILMNDPERTAVKSITPTSISG
ncbi:MAG: hypothetical protein IAF58_09060 [Leptolyngbya sp.]|nr:hypothetical protein [Candidatus Melainabacteria bacterium]